MRLAILFASLLYAQSTYATGQVPDYMVYQGDTIAIFSNPLEQYFELKGKRWLPDFNGGCGSTNCWRGYMAIWELRNDSLFLRRVTSCMKDCGTPHDADLVKMFGTGNVYAFWFTGGIMSPKGKLVEYVHMGYASVYEEERWLTFDKGKLKKLKIKSNKKIADKIYAQQRSVELAKLSLDTIFYHVNKNIDWSKDDSLGDFCDDSYHLIFSKRGKIKNVVFEPIFESKKENRAYNREESYCRRKINRALKGLSLDYLHSQERFTIPFEIFLTQKNISLSYGSPWNGRIKS